jgi:hypothetical protein
MTNDEFLPVKEAAQHAMTTEGALAKRIERGMKSGYLTPDDLRWQGKKRLVRLSAVLALGRDYRNGRVDDKDDTGDNLSELRADLDYAVDALRRDVQAVLEARLEVMRREIEAEFQATQRQRQEEMREVWARLETVTPRREHRPFLGLSSVLRRG